MLKPSNRRWPFDSSSHGWQAELKETRLFSTKKFFDVLGASEYSAK